MDWKEEFIKLLEAGTFKTNSEIDDYADEHIFTKRYNKRYVLLGGL